MLPTLVANGINAGSPFATTYGAADAVAPALSADVLRSYASDPQILLLVLAFGWTVQKWVSGRRHIASVLAANFLINVAFFIAHPLYTQYYMIPICAVSLWTLLFEMLLAPVRRRVDGKCEYREPTNQEEADYKTREAW